MHGKSAARARRTARAIDRGQEILDLLCMPELQAAITATANLGQPPVSAISQRLLDTFGRHTMQTTATKMFVGLCVRAILGEEYELAASRVRMSNDPLFSTGAVYKKLPQTNSSDEKFLYLHRILRAVDDIELDIAIKILEERRRKL